MTRRQLERLWERTTAEDDRLAYRAVCCAADNINASRSAFYALLECMAVLSLMAARSVDPIFRHLWIFVDFNF